MVATVIAAIVVVAIATIAATAATMKLNLNQSLGLEITRFSATCCKCLP